MDISQVEENFDERFGRDIGRALRIPAAAVVVISKSAGSVIVTFAISSNANFNATGKCTINPHHDLTSGDTSDKIACVFRQRRIPVRACGQTGGAGEHGPRLDQPAVHRARDRAVELADQHRQPEARAQSRASAASGFRDGHPDVRVIRPGIPRLREQAVGCRVLHRYDLQGRARWYDFAFKTTLFNRILIEIVCFR